MEGNGTKEQINRGDLIEDMLTGNKYYVTATKSRGVQDSATQEWRVVQTIGFHLNPTRRNSRTVWRDESEVNLVKRVIKPDMRPVRRVSVNESRAIFASQQLAKKIRGEG